MANQQQPPKKKMSNLIRLSLFWAILVFSVLAVIAITAPNKELKEVAISEVISRANKGEISEIKVQGNDLTITPKGEDEPTEKSVKQEGSLTEQGLEAGKTTVQV